MARPTLHILGRTMVRQQLLYFEHLLIVLLVDMSIIGGMGGLNLLSEHETHMSYGEVGLAQPQMQSEFGSPYLPDVHQLYWSPGSTQSTPSQLCTPSDMFDDPQPGICPTQCNLSPFSL